MGEREGGLGGKERVRVGGRVWGGIKRIGRGSSVKEGQC